MYISLDWISDYVDLAGLSVETVVSRLTLGTAEVEGIKTVQRYVNGVVIGQIVAVEKLTDKLTFCEVDCGDKKHTTVCGAPNARLGLKAAFAPAGTVLAKNFRVEETVKEGRKSQGVLCSAAELGLSDWHEILLECPENCLPGTPLIDFIPEQDTLIEIDNKSLTHRPDLWGHYGFAREFSAIFGRKLKALPQLDLSQYDKLPAYPLVNDAKSVEQEENCPAYGCIEFQTKGTIPSPLFMQRRLHALGLRSYNLLVDVTNYVNWEIGQPAHAFDAEKLGGVRVAALGGSDTFVTLDGQKRNLCPEDLLIWGSKADGGHRPVALAGIMGGLETEVTETTTKILLESANFKAARIRRTSTRLDLRSDASQRYEKSQPPSNVKVGAARILKLIEESDADLKVLSRFTVDGDLQDEIRRIELPAGRLEQLAGIELPAEKVLGILQSLEFEAAFDENQNLMVGVPPFRSKKDVSIPEDIVEEVLRVYGYDNIPPVMPTQPLAPLHVEPSMKMEHKIRKLLAAGHRFFEVHNYIWFNDNTLKTLDFEPGKTLILKNPTSPETARLRTTLMPNLLALVPKNRPFRDSFRLFEIGRRFLPSKTKNECNELPTLGGVAFQQSGNLEAFYLSVKSAVEDVFKICGLRGTRFIDTDSQPTPGRATPWETRGFWVQIRHDDQAVGTLGVLAPDVMKKLCPEGGQIVWFEIELDKLPGKLFPEVTFTEPPRYPLSWQDFSLVWGVEDGFEKLQALLDEFSHPLIVRREFLVSYQGKGLEKGTASYSFRFWIGANDHTLSGEEIDGFHETFLSFVKEHDVALRA